MKDIALYRHPTPFRELWRRHKEHWSKAELVRTTFISVASFLVSIFLIQPYAVNFATAHASSGVADIILSNIPVFDVDGLFVYGMFTLVAFITLLCLGKPKRTPFILYSLSTFIILRSFFVCLTHVGPFATYPTSSFGPGITKAFFGADFFFSGHTGAPFLMALIFWQYKPLRVLFLAWSVFFGIIVLLGHLHYSIDVLGAFFITYAIYDLCCWLFPESYALFHSKSL